MNNAFSRFQSLDPGPAAQELSACCSASAWVAVMVAQRPFGSLAELLRIADFELNLLDWPQIEQAAAMHPRIGERSATTGVEAEWSQREQSTARAGDATVRAELGAAIDAYEKQFDRVFLICAEGKDAAEILTDAKSRIHNDETLERIVVREELRKIVRLRLWRWLG